MWRRSGASQRLVTIRHETASDREAVFRVEAAAFAEETEARLVDQLRDNGHSILSLVAEADDDMHRLAFSLAGLVMQLWTQRDPLQVIAPQLASSQSVDLWVDRPANRYDRDWNAAGLESRVAPRTEGGRAVGWTATSFLPWTALAAKAPQGTAVPPRPGDRWRFNVYRIERPNGPSDPDRDARYFAWSPTGERTFHVPAAFREIEFR